MSLEDVTLVEEHAAKQALAAYGVDVPVSVQVDRTADVVLPEVQGPVAVKGVGLAHKSEAGAVQLGVSLRDLPDVMAAMPTDQVLIEEMVEDGIAELLIGVTRDPAHGFVLTLGAGGVLTEILQDTESLIVPAARESIEGAFIRLKLAPVLNGYRGKSAANMAALVDAVMAVQRYVVDHADSLDEIEINPLIVTADRAVAVDALIRKADT